MDKNDIPHMSNMKPISNVVDVVFDVLRSTSMKIDWKDARTNLILFLYHKANLERNPNFQQQIDSFDKFLGEIQSANIRHNQSDLESIYQIQIHKDILKVYWDFFKGYSLLETNQSELESVLLSLTLEKKGGGLYQIPKEVSDFIINLIKPKQSEKIYIPFMTSASFLLSCLDYHNGKSESQNFSEQIHVEQRNFELSIILDLILLLRNTRVRQTLNDVRRKSYFEQYDHIIANPAHGLDHKDDFSFLKLLVEQENKPKNIAIIVSPNFLWKNDKSSRIIRNEILANYKVRALIQFPRGIFYKVMIAPTLVVLEKRDKVIDLNKIKDENVFASIIDDSFLKYWVLDKKILSSIEKKYNKFLKSKTFPQTQETFLFDSRDLVDNTWTIPNKFISETDLMIPFAQSLGNLIEIKRGIALKTQEFEKNVPPNFKEYVRISDIDDSGKIKKSKRFVESKLKLKSLESATSQVDDILLSNRATIGKTALIGKKDAGKIISSQIFILRLKENEIVLPKYLYLVLSSQKIKDKLISYGKGSTYLGISPSDVQQLIVSIPPISEQENRIRKYEQEFESVAQEIRSLEKRLAELRKKLSDYEL